MTAVEQLTPEQGRAARVAALYKLDPAETAIIEAAAGLLADHCAYLSRDGALEVLSSIGAALSRHHLRTSP